MQGNIHRKLLVGALGLATLVGGGFGCQAYFLKAAVFDAGNYFSGPGREGTSLDKVADHVYSFRWTWYRNLVIETTAGWVVTDPFNAEAAKAMKDALEKVSPGKPVHTVIYSHYHLDHVMGGETLAAEEVLAHELCAGYWNDLGAKVFAPTRILSGDETLKVGTEEIRLIHLPKSHTDTLFAVYLPAEKVLWTADLGLVKAFPPDGVPDHYQPGYLAALEKLGKLDFTVFIPSHHGYGTKQDFMDYLEFLRFSDQLTGSVLAKYGPAFTSAALADMFEGYYGPMKQKYGDWFGFDQQVLFMFLRGIEGHLLGY